MSAFSSHDWQDRAAAMSPAELHRESIIAHRERSAAFADMAALWRTSSPKTAAECLRISLEEAAKADALRFWSEDNGTR